MIYTDLNNLERYLGMGKHLDTAMYSASVRADM